jgi:hypothetical protein
MKSVPRIQTLPQSLCIDQISRTRLFGVPACSRTALQRRLESHRNCRTFSTSFLDFLAGWPSSRLVNDQTAFRNDRAILHPPVYYIHDEDKVHNAWCPTQIRVKHSLEASSISTVPRVQRSSPSASPDIWRNISATRSSRLRGPMPVSSSTQNAHTA